MCKKKFHTMPRVQHECRLTTSDIFIFIRPPTIYIALNSYRVRHKYTQGQLGRGCEGHWTPVEVPKENFFFENLFSSKTFKSKIS